MVILPLARVPGRVGIWKHCDTMLSMYVPSNGWHGMKEKLFLSHVVCILTVVSTLEKKGKGGVYVFAIPPVGSS